MSSVSALFVVGSNMIRGLCLITASVFFSTLVFADAPKLKRPDGKPADMSQPVQVYILMGQSNMLGFGKTATLSTVCKQKGLYPYLIDDSGNWTVRKDVRNVRVMCSGTGAAKTFNNEWMTIKGKAIGPEIGIGHHLGQAIDAPVMILKSCIGNRSLGYDLLPPSAEGYKGSSDPSKRPKGVKWYAGIQYDGDTDAAKKVLEQLDKHYPGAKEYEVAGFFFWQGDKDFRNADHAAKYEKHLLNLIESLRKTFNAPEARFVCASLGQTKKGAGGAQGKILQAKLNIDGKTGKYKSHKGMVASVYSHPLSKGSSSSGHYGGNPETYMNVGEAMGAAMVAMLKPAMPEKEFMKNLDKYSRSVHTAIKGGRYSKAYTALEALTANVAELEKSGELDEKELETKKTIHTILKGKYNRAYNDAMEQIKECQAMDDTYKLSIVLPKLQKTFKGIPKFDEIADILKTDLKTKEARKEITNGRTFYKYIEKAIKTESRSKAARTERKALSYKKYLESMAKRFKESRYADAARKAANEVSDPSVSFKQPEYYLK